MAFQDGEQVGAYRIIEQLGRGGMATVYKAYHANLDRYIALKVLHPAFMQDPNFLARFEREAKVVAMLHHPNIIPVYDFEEHNTSPYLVMKYVKGETLKARLNRKNLTAQAGVEIIEAVGKGLTYAHSQNILHRDVKPSNVILGDDGAIYLADFGLARIATAGESTMSGDMMLGTPQYISPEQAMGKRELDEGTDIYSFGVMIYEIVVGQVPFISDTPFSIVHDHIFTALPLPRAINPKVPESVERVLLKALAKERADRFDSIADLVDAFKRAAQGETMPDAWGVTEMAGGQPTIQVDTTTPQPAQTGSAPSGTPPPAPAHDTASQAKPKRSGWKKFGLGIIGTMVFCACSLLIIDTLNDESVNTSTNAALNEETEARQEQLSQELANEVAIDQANTAIEADPENPIAHLELAITLYDAELEEEATEAFEAAKLLAGNNPEFYVTAGDMLETRENWVLALQQYAQAIDFGYNTETSGFSAKVMKTLYYASENPEIQPVLFEDLQEDNPLINKSILLASRARYALLVEDDIARAEEIMSRLNDLEHQTPYINLVRAELLLATENYDEARTILAEIAQTEGNSIRWIRVEASRILSQIP